MFRLVPELRTDDYTASEENAGKTWVRTDLDTGALKSVVGHVADPAGVWSSAPSLVQARDAFAMIGSETAATLGGGNPNTTWAYEFDGTWARTVDMSTGRVAPSGLGNSESDGLICGGETDSTEEWDGVAFSAGPTMVNATKWSPTGGTKDDGIICGGDGQVNSVQTFDGSTFSAGIVYPIVIQTAMGSGAADDMLVAGGYSGAYTSVSYKFDGAAWESSGNLSQARSRGSAMGVSTAEVVVVGGFLGSMSYSAVTDRYVSDVWETWTSYPRIVSSQNMVESSGRSGMSCGGFDASGGTGRIQQCYYYLLDPNTQYGVYEWQY